MRASYQNIYFHSHSLKKKTTDKNKLNSSLHFVMARCDKQDSDSTLSPALPLRTDTTSQSRGHDDRQGELFWLDTLGEMDGRGFHLKEKIFYIIENGESGFKSTENKPSNN